MATSLKERLNADVKAALKSGDKARAMTLRLVLAAFKQYEVDERREVDADTAVELLTRMAKQRRESIAQYEQGNREDLAEKERDELALITEYLPAQLSESEVEAAIEAAIASTGATGMRDMGKVMGHLGGALKGRADLAAVSARVKARLAG